MSANRNKFSDVVLLMVFTAFLAGCSTTQEEVSEQAWLQEHPLNDADDSALFVDEEFTNEEEDDKQQLLDRANKSLANGDYDGALFAYLRALRMDENDATIYYQIGRVHEMRNNYALAELAYRKAISLDKAYIAAIERTGKMLLKRRQYIAAGNMFSEAIALDQLRLQSRLKQQGYLRVIDRAAKNAAASDDVDAKAIITAESISEHKRKAIMRPVYSLQSQAMLSYVLKENTLKYYDKTSPLFAYNGLAVIADMDKNHDLAMQHYQLARAISPRSPMVFNNIGYSYYLVNDMKEAEEQFNKAIYMDKNYAEAWRNLSLIYVRRGQYKKAINLLIAQFDGEASAYNTVGYICMLDSKFERAEQYFNKAIELSPIYYRAANENRERNRELYSSTVYQTITYQ